jgi:HEAT repeat
LLPHILPALDDHHDVVRYTAAAALLHLAQLERTNDMPSRVVP